MFLDRNFTSLASVLPAVGRRELRDIRDRSPNGIPPFPQPEGPGRRMVALYDYDPRELSPNVDKEVCRCGHKYFLRELPHGDQSRDDFTLLTVAIIVAVGNPIQGW